jgi:hypothetical protein
MDRLGRVAEEVLDRHPAPALPLEELNALMALEGPDEPDPETLVRAIRDESPSLRVVEGDRERLGAVGPSRWIVAPPGSRRGQFPPRSVEARLRESLRILGAAVEPGSTVSLARWARLLYEEERIRRIIARPEPATARRRWAGRRAEVR